MLYENFPKLLLLKFNVMVQRITLSKTTCVHIHVQQTTVTVYTLIKPWRTAHQIVLIALSQHTMMAAYHNLDTAKLVMFSFSTEYTKGTSGKRKHNNTAIYARYIDICRI